MKTKFELKLKDILFIAITAVVFGIFYLGMVYFGAFLTTLLTPIGLGILGYEPIYGVWFMAATFTTYIVQKPYIGIVAEMLAALIEVLLGNFFGPIVFISGFLQGLGAEIGFATFKYKKYNYVSTILSAIIAAIFSLFWTGIRSNYAALDIKLVIAICVIRISSAIFFCGIGAKSLADGLEKAGVLKGYALGQKSIK